MDSCLVWGDFSGCKQTLLDISSTFCAHLFLREYSNITRQIHARAQKLSQYKWRALSLHTSHLFKTLNRNRSQGILRKQSASSPVWAKWLFTTWCQHNVRINDCKCFALHDQHACFYHLFTNDKRDSLTLRCIVMHTWTTQWQSLIGDSV